MVSTVNDNLSFNSLSELKNTIKEYCLKFKNFILSLRRNNSISSTSLENEIINFRNSLRNIGKYLYNLGFKDEYYDLASIKNECIYILENKYLFKKFSRFITEILDLFANLVSHLEDNDYNIYYEKFSLDLDKYGEFFDNNILISFREDEEISQLVSRSLHGGY